MPVDISISDKELILKLSSNLAPRHESQLSFWGFHFDAIVDGLKCEPENLAQLLIKLTKYFNRNNIRFELNKKAGDIFNEHIKISGELHNALQIGNTLKDGNLKLIDIKEFYLFLSTNIARPLKEHQIKAMHDIQNHGGEGFFLIYFNESKSLNKLTANDVIDLLENGVKSIKFDPKRQTSIDVLGIFKNEHNK